MKENKDKLRDEGLKFYLQTGNFINNDISYTKDVIKNMDKKEKTKYYANKFVRYVNKLSQNKFIQSLMRGFMMIIPLLIVGGIFSLIMSVPENIANAVRSPELEKWVLPTWLKQICQKVFNLTFGIAGILSCLCITYEMTRHINRELRESRQIYPIVTVVASFTCYMIFLVGNVYATGGDQINFDSISLKMLGTLGMLPGLLIALFVPYIYKWCYKYNWIIQLPKIVPKAILLSIIVLIPLMISVVVYLVPSWLVLHFSGQGIFEWMNEKALGSIYEASNSYGFYMPYQLLNSICYFTGIHNSIISNIFESVRKVNVHVNFVDLTNGLKPNNIFVGATSTNMIGGLGSLIMVPMAIILFTKSKQIKSIGYIALISCTFNLPEPVLFGLPVILNPVLLAPMLLAPFLNASLEWFFVHEFGMNAPYADVAWCLPWVFVLPISTGFDPMSFLAMLSTIAVSFIVWSPFVIIQDKILIKGEKASGEYEVDGLFHDSRNGIQVIWDWMFHHKENIEIMLKVKETKKIVASEKALEEIETYKKTIIENQAKARLKLTQLNEKVIQNNILIIDSDEEKAKNLGRTIIMGLENKPDLVLFLKTITNKKRRIAEKLAKNAQLVLISESCKDIYEDIEIVTNLKNHLIYPLSDIEMDNLIKEPLKAINLVDELTVQTNRRKQNAN